MTMHLLTGLPCGHVVRREEISPEGDCLICRGEATARAELRARPRQSTKRGQRLSDVLNKIAKKEGIK